MRNTSFTRDHLPLLILITLLFPASLLTVGCRKDPSDREAPPPTAAKPPADKTSALNIPAPRDPLRLVEPVVPPQQQIERAIAAAKVTLAGGRELDAVIKNAQVRATQTAQLKGPTAQACQQAAESELILGDQFVEITPPAPYEHGQYLPADLQLSLPLTPEQCAGATARNVGVLHVTPTGSVAIDGYYDEARAAVVVEVAHLSGFVSFRRDPLNDIKHAVNSEASRRACAELEVTRLVLNDQLIKSVEAYLKHKAFNEVEGCKRNILASLSRHRATLTKRFAASGGRDPAGFFRSFQGLVGKTIVDNVPASDMPGLLAAVTDSTDITAAVAQAAERTTGGDYWAAVDVLGNAYAQHVPGYRLSAEAAATVNTGWRALNDDAVETLFQEDLNDDFHPSRIAQRPGSLKYLKRKFPKADGKTMTDTEVVAFLDACWDVRYDHAKASAVLQAQIEEIHAWYAHRAEIATALGSSFNQPNAPDCFRHFLRILDTINNHLMRMGIYRSPWTARGAYLPQPEVAELLVAFEQGGVAGFNRAVQAIEGRLARPLDLSEYGGFWVLADSQQKTLWTRESKRTNEYRLEASAARERAQAYTGDAQLSASITKSIPGERPEAIEFQYRAAARIAFDSPPAAVPNGTNWDVALQMEAEEFCTSGEPEVPEEISHRLGMPTRLGGQGASPRFVECAAAVIPGARNRTRVRSPDDLVPVGPTHFNAAQAQPWTSPIPVRFTLIPETTKSTAEEFVLILEARTPSGAFREEHTYRWSKQLPKELETELQQQILRDNFRGVRSSKADMAAAVSAQPTAPATPTKTVVGSKTQISALKYVPQRLVVKKEAAFELTVENGPRVPSFAWSFGETAPGRTDSWTTVTQCKYTYFKPGTFTVTVKMRDKNNYAKGDLATASWQVTVFSGEDDAFPTAPASPAAVAQGDPATPQDTPDQPGDNTGPLQLTFPAGRSPKVFTKGWLFGARCVVQGPDGEDIDLSDRVKWSGTGKFSPAVGNRSRPTFKTAGSNTITLTAEIDGKDVTQSFKVDAIFPLGYAAVGGEAYCPADAHGGPQGATSVRGPINSGSPTVLLGGRPAARVGDVGVHAVCDGPNSFKITDGDPLVLIDGRPAARIGSSTEHCGGYGRIVSTGN